MSLHRIFEGQAIRQPDKVAIEYQGTNITYGELDAAANQLATYIKHVDACKSGVAALSLEKDPLTVTAVLAILKAGLAWVPLPLDAPRSRIENILAISDPALVLCSKATEHVSHGLLCKTVVLDEPETKERIRQQSAGGMSANPNDIDPADLCHIIFTSGSTGQPKGVMLEHQAVVHNVQVLANRFGLNQYTRTLQFAAYTFDVFGLDVFMTFYAGGCLVMGVIEDIMSDLTGFISRSHVNYAQLTPTIISLIDPAQTSTLRVLASSGEPLTAKILHDWVDRVRLINAYGPTETIVCTVQDMNGTHSIEPEFIGTAIPGLDVVLMREDGPEEVPPGSVGEVCVAGVQLFRGYIGVDDRHPKQVFHRGSQMFYRTGDLGVLTHLVDSAPTIRLLGRRDGQVKVHGVRIDLGEVEEVLHRHSGTRKCTTVVPKAGLFVDRLAAVVSISESGPWRLVGTTMPGTNVLQPTQPGQKAALISLIDWVRSRLPPQAVPSIWWIVDEFPLTSSGKLDRMLVQGWLESVSEHEFAEFTQSWATEDEGNSRPNGKELCLERQLIEIGSRALGLNSAFIDPRVSLLQLGFDSLGIFRLVDMSRSQGLNLSVHQVLRECSIRELSSSLCRAGADLDFLDEVDIKPFSLVSPSSSARDLKAFVAEQCHVDMNDILDIYPCTPLQAGMMALAARRSDAYVCDLEYLISAEVDINRFWGVWESFLSRTPFLRNRIVHDIRGVGLLQTTVRHVEKSHSDETFKMPMSFGDNLCRGRIVRDETTQTWKFILRIHHALIDGWTKDLIVLELRNIYNRSNMKDSDPPSPGSNAFTKYIRYLIEDISSHEAQHISFWRNRLENCTVTDFPRMPSEWKGDLMAEHDVLTYTITAGVSAIARHNQVKATTVVQAAWAIVLGKHSCTDDVIFGSTLSGRDAPLKDISSIIGPTLVTVPCRVRWNNTTTVGQLLRRLYEESIDLIPHQHYGLQNIANIGQDAKNALLFRSLLVVQPGSAAIHHQKDFLQEEEQSGPDMLGTYPITVEFMLSDSSSTNKVRIHHDKSIVPKKTATWMLRHLEAALSAIGSANLDTRVSDIEVLSEDERIQVMALQRTCPPKINRCLHDLVQETVRKYPDHVAVVQYLPAKSLTYEQLDQSSTSLAQHLQWNYRLGPGSIVPLAFEKSALAIVAMLAVLKTGAAYVALDTWQPVPHLQRIVGPLKPKYMLCSTQTYQKLHNLVEHGLEIDDAWLSGIHPRAVTLPKQKHHCSPDDTALLFFTSGSTGQPKCIASRHSAVSTSMYHSARFLRIEPGARVFQSTSFAFDMSLKDIYCTLLSGACICLPSDTDRLSAEIMHQMNVGVAFLTPSVAKVIVPEDVPSLRILNLGGERPTESLIRQWAKRVRLINAYGPTETVACLCFADDMDENADPADIGQPITGQAWIVQRNSKGSLVLAASECIGEIAISGNTVAQGYLNDATKTAECFVKQPAWMKQSSSDSESYLYLTGDLGVKNQNGEISILGRKDAQVKINGVRIELGEAECALRRLGGIFTSAVVDAVRHPIESKPDASTTVLVAFVSIETSDSNEGDSSFMSSGSLLIHPDAAILKTFNVECRSAQKELAQQVPRHLVPRLFIPIKAVPLTVSGKTDRKKLRAALEDDPHRDLRVANRSDVTQRRPSSTHNTLEARVSGIWQETFGKKKNFKLSDNFFNVGGDSLMAIRLVMVCKQHGLLITVEKIYEHPTLAQMAATVVERSDIRSAHSLRAESPAPFSLLPSHARKEIVAEAAAICNIDAKCIEDVYPAAPFQEELAAINLQDKKAYMARWVYSLPRETNTKKLEHALEVVVARNPIFRTTLAHTSKGTVQVIIKMTEWERQQQSAIDGGDAHLQLEGNLRLFRYRCYTHQGEEDKPYLQVDMHHILYDEWTVHYFLTDLSYNYGHANAERPGRPSYANFIRQLVDVEGKDEAATAFWKLDLKDAEEQEFPRRPLGPHQFITNSVIQSSNPISMEHGEMKNGDRLVVTSATIAAASLAIVLSSYSKSKDITFGLTLSGRLVPGLEEVAGPTIYTVPLRTRINGRQDISVFLSNIQSKIRNIQDFQHFGLQKIARLDIRGAKASCAFRTLLVVQQGAGAAFSSENQELQLTAVEQETFMSLNYGLVVNLVTDVSHKLAKFKIEFDSACVTQQQADKVLGQLHQIAGRLSSMEGTVGNLLDDICGYEQNGRTESMGHSSSGTMNAINTRNTVKSDRRAGQMPQCEALSELWAKVMDMSPEHISLDDSISTLGGDSITLIRLLSTARRSGISLPFGDRVNQFTTLAEMVNAMTTISHESQDTTDGGISAPRPFSLIEGLSKDDCIKDAATKCDVDPTSVVDVYPCSPLQEGLMAVSATEPGAYITQHCYKVLGNLDQKRLESALSRVCKAESILRTRIFITSELQTAQAVLNNESPSFGVYRHYSTLHEYIERDSKIPFEFRRPLTRFALVFDIQGQAYLVISQHHAVSDGWTLRLLEDAIKREYNKHDMPHHDTIANQIPAFIKFVKEVQKSADAAHYWKTTLAGARVTEFPRLGRDETFQTTDQIANSCAIPIPSSNGIPLSVLLEAAWGLVLSKYSGCDDVCFGVVRSGRTAPVQGIETMMGPTIATIPRRLKPKPMLRVAQYLDEVLSLANRAVPFEQYGLPNIRLLGADARNACNFRTLLVVQPKHQRPEQEVVPGELAIELLDGGFMLDNYGLTVDCQPCENGTLSIYVSYDKNYSSAAEATRISKDFIRAISQLGEGTERALSDIDIFSEHGLNPARPLVSQEGGTQGKPTLSSSVNGEINKAHHGQSNGFSMPSCNMNHVAAQKIQSESSPRDILRRLWADVLHIEAKSIDVDDDFLMLGGDSISAIKLSAHAREHGISLSAKSILQEPILKKMVLRMSELQTQTQKVQVKEDHPKWNGRQNYPAQISETYGIAIDDIEDVYQCTPLQINLMATTLRQPGAYVATETFRLSPLADVRRFMQAWELVYQRHEMLRTRLCQVFDDEGHATLVQVVCASDAVPWHISTSDEPPYQHQQQKQQQLLPEMNLGTPLSSFRLLRTLDGDTHFQLTRHHSIYDGWSTRMLWDDFKYAHAEGSSPPSRPPFRSYVQHLESLDTTAITDFWKKQLDGFHGEHYPAPLKSHSLPSEASNLSSVGLDYKIHKEVDRSFNVFGFPDVARGAWALVLSLVGRWPSQTHDVCFGCVVSGRMVSVVGIEDIAGPTMGTVPMRIKIDMNQLVTHYLQHVRDNTLAMTDFEHIGPSTIRHVSDEARTACQFQNLLVVQPPKVESVGSASGLDGICEAVEAGDMLLPYSLVVECTQNADGSGFRLEASFEEASIDESEVRALLGTFSRIITLLGESSRGGTSIGDLVCDLGRIQDYEQMLSFNGPSLPTSKLCLHEIFEASARINPRGMAVLAHDQELTYEALDNAANLLAGHLRQKLKFGTKSLVPICFEKSSFMIISMLAIMKAGGAYVPLDPSHPPARLRDMIDQCKSNLILVSAAQEYGISQVTSLQTLAINSSLLKLLCDTNIPLCTEAPYTAGSHDVAYMIFTSGSTGKPKGVLMEHGSVALSMLQYAGVFGYSSIKELRVLQFSSYTFDVSVAEIFSTLAFGGTVCVPREEDRLNDLIGVVSTMKVSVAFLTPTMANTLQPDDVPTLEVLCMTGEALTPSLVQVWSEAPNTKLFNAYGPTEAAVHCAAGRIRRVMSHKNIGSPFGGQLWIVDPEDHTKLRPVGCTGELVISGSTLARGYLNNVEQTSKAFINDVVWFEGVAPRRIYKTGDMARYRGDGTIEFLGRKDSRQVKFHGLRIELGEIEAAINSSDKVGALLRVVVEKLSISERDTLVAFLQLKTSSTPERESQDILIPSQDIPRSTKAFIRIILASLQDLLPRYMIPSLLLPVSRWSHSTSGKTDHQLLRKLATDLSETDVDMYRAFADGDDNLDGQVMNGDNEYMYDVSKSQSLTTLGINGDHKSSLSPQRAQDLVTSLWKKVLRRGADFRPSLDHDFFSLGGDSVSAIFLVAEFRREEIQITVGDIFIHKTIASMVDLILSRQRIGEDNTPSPPLVSPTQVNKPFSLVQTNGVKLQSLCNEVAAGLGISPDSIQDIYPCTPLQEGITFLSERVEGSYHAQLDILMPRRLDLDKLYNALRKLVEMHDILRTRIIFHSSLGSMQVVLTAEAHFLEAQREKSRGDDEPVRFGYGLPLHQHALTAKDDRIYLRLDCHHSIYDGWSLPLLMGDLRRLYYQDSEYHAETAPRPFRDLVAYVHNPSVVRAGDDFWGRYLHGAVMSDFPELAGRTHQSIRATTFYEQRISLDADQFPKDKTMATVLTTAWSIVVSRHTASNDVCFGLLLSGRNAPVPGIEGIRGPTITTVPFRVQLDYDAATIANTLDRVQSHLLDMIPHQFTSLSSLGKAFSDGHGQFGSLLSIQTEMRAVRDDDMNGCQSEFSIYTTPTEEEGTPVIFGEPYALFLAVDVDQESGSIVLGAQYDPRIISADHMTCIIGQYEVVIRQLANVESRNVRLDDVELLSESDRQRLLAWAGEAVKPGDMCVHEMIEKMARDHPHHQAVEGFAESLTFAQLDQQSNSLASHLLQLGKDHIHCGMTIPVWMETSPAAVVAILAILKLGASYVPLDHRFPVSRAEYIVDDTSAKIMLVSKEKSDVAAELVNRLESQKKSLTIFQVEDMREAMKILDGPRSQVIPPELTAKTSDLAYVIYTSGSTGQPKGVMMEHWSLTATVKEQAITYGLNLDTRMFGLSSLSWDPSLLEIFATLSHGGCLCIPTEEERSGCMDLVGSINRHRANQISTSPAVASLIDLRATPTVKVMSLGGEMIREENVLNAHQAGVHLLNIYGPTEACIDAIAHRNVVPGVSPQNIGRPMSSQVWIVDPTNPQRLVPPGCAGELVLSGTLARGYLNDEAKTARSFLTNCSFASPVYLTGDIGRYDMDGSIYFLGRKDRQVKLNGQRVELGDIENAVRTLRPQNDVAVDYFADSDDAKKLLVVYLSRPSATSSSSQPPWRDGRATCPVRIESRMRPDSKEFQQLQEQLRALLPRYMVPRVFVTVSRLPLSIADKIDVKLLRATYTKWAQESSSSPAHPGPKHQTIMAPEEPEPLTSSLSQLSCSSEVILRNIWASAIGCDGKSIRSQDDIFDLGADSLTVIRVATLARKEGYNLSVPQIYAFPTLSQMAKLLESESQQTSTTVNSKGDDIPPFSLLPTATRLALPRCSDIVDILPCSYFQTTAIIQGQKRHKAYYAWFLVRITGPLDLDRLQAACRLLVQRHAVLRTSYRILDGEFVQQVHRSVHMVSEIQNLGSCSSEEAFVALLDADVPSPVSFERILTRFRIASCYGDSDGGHLLGIGMSHAQYDGFCWARIFDDLYHAYRAGTLYNNALQPPSFSRFISHSLKTSTDFKTKSFWTELLNGAKMTSLSSQTGEQRPWLPLDKKQIRTLPRFWPRLGNATFAIVVKAAWALVLSWLSNTTDVVFGSLVFGRNPQIDGMEEIVGACINVVPNRVSLSETRLSTVGDLLEMIQQQQISIMPFETTSLPEVSRYVRWPAGTRFGSIVQHQNVDEDVFTADASLSAGATSEGYQSNGASWSFAGSASYPGLCDDLLDCWIFTDARPQEMILYFQYNNTTIPDDCAARITQLVCDVIHSIHADPSRPLKSIRPPQSITSSLRMQILRAAQTYGGATSNETETGRGQRQNGLSGERDRISLVLRKLWAEVLPVSPFACEVDDNTSFFALGGNDMLAEQLAAACQNQRLNLSAQDISFFPTVGMQTALLCGDCRSGNATTEDVHLVLEPK